MKARIAATNEKTALDIAEKTKNPGKETIIVCLTDGHATEGTINNQTIISNVKANNRDEVSIYGLAFGDEADFKLLRAISHDNSAFATAISSKTDSSIRLGDFFRSLTPPIMSNVNFEYPNQLVDEDSVTGKNIKALKEGREFIVAGKLLEDVNPQSLRAKVQGNTRQGRQVNDVEPQEVDKSHCQIIHRLWAFLKVKTLLKKAKELTTKGTKKFVSDTLQKKALALSLEYQFVTPLTALNVLAPKSAPINSTLADSDCAQYSSGNTNRPPFGSGPVSITFISVHGSIF